MRIFLKKVMKVILLEDVKALGKKNEVVEVNEGYAKNFLFKTKKAVEANGANLNTLKVKTGAAQAAKARELAAAQTLGTKLEGKTFKIALKAGEGGRLYGSLTAHDVSEALKKAGYEVDKKDIIIKEALKFVGQTKATLKLHTQVKVDVDVLVEAL